MAVLFNKDGFTIKIHTIGNPIEDWVNTRDELLDLFQCRDMNMANENKYFRVLQLIRSMTPDLDTLNKMTSLLFLLFSSVEGVINANDYLL